MPDVWEEVGEGVDRGLRIAGFAEGRRARKVQEEQNQERLRLAGAANDRAAAEYEARMADRAEYQRAQGLAAQSDARATTDQARRTVSGNYAATNPVERIQGALERNAGTPYAQHLGALAVAAMDNMSLAGAAAYIDRVEGVAASVKDPQLRQQIMDDRLYDFERVAAEREVGEFQEISARLGPTVFMASPGGGEAKAPTQGQQAQGATDPNQTIAGGLQLLQGALQQARTRSDYAAIRGGVRKLTDAMFRTAERQASRQADIEKIAAVQQAERQKGLALIQAGAVDEGLAKLEFAANYPLMSVEDRSKAAREGSQFQGASGYSNEPGPAGGPSQVQQIARALTGGGDVPRGTSGEGGGQSTGGSDEDTAAWDALKPAEQRSRLDQLASMAVERGGGADEMRAVAAELGIPVSALQGEALRDLLAKVRTRKGRRKEERGAPLAQGERREPQKSLGKDFWKDVESANRTAAEQAELRPQLEAAVRRGDTKEVARLRALLEAGESNNAGG